MHSLCTRVSLERNCQSRHGRQLFCNALALAVQRQHGRETKSSSTRNGRIVCSPPSNLRTTRKMWSAGARLLRVFRLFSFWVLAAAAAVVVAAAAVAAHFRVVNDVYSGAVTLHTILCWAVDVFFHYDSVCRAWVAPDIFHLSFDFIFIIIHRVVCRLKSRASSHQ